MVNSNKTTDPQHELLTEVDDNNNVIGSISRQDAHNNPSKFYRTIMVLVKNQNDEILIQKRSSTKDLYPNCWDLSVGGHVSYGNTYEETAVRELHEELGINTTKKDLILRGEVLVSLPNSNEFFNVFEYTLKETDHINLNTTEINSIKWLNLESLKKSIENNELEWYPRPIQIINKLY